MAEEEKTGGTGLEAEESKFKASFKKHKEAWIIGIGAGTLILTYLIYRQGQQGSTAPSLNLPVDTSAGGNPFDTSSSQGNVPVPVGSTGSSGGGSSGGGGGGDQSSGFYDTGSYGSYGDPSLTDSSGGNGFTANPLSTVAFRLGFFKPNAATPAPELIYGGKPYAFQVPPPVAKSVSSPFVAAKPYSPPIAQPPPPPSGSRGGGRFGF